MTRFRSVLTLTLIFVTVLLINFVSPAFAAKAPAYTPTQVELLQRYESKVVDFRKQLPKLATLIENRQWTDVRDFIHGPLGELRVQMTRLTRQLSPALKSQATELAKEVGGHLVEIDEAAAASDYRQSIRNYAEAVKDFDAFLKLIPSA